MEFSDSIPRKYILRSGHIEIRADKVHVFDSDGKKLKELSYSEYAAKAIKKYYPSEDALREQWIDTSTRTEVFSVLENKGIFPEQLAASINRPDADPLDLLCHLAFENPLRSRNDRVERLMRDQKEFFDQFEPEAREILDAFLNNYIKDGMNQLHTASVMETTSVAQHGNIIEIVGTFGGIIRFEEAMSKLQTLLYKS